MKTAQTIEAGHTIQKEYLDLYKEQIEDAREQIEVRLFRLQQLTDVALTYHLNKDPQSGNELISSVGNLELIMEQISDLSKEIRAYLLGVMGMDVKEHTL